MFPPPAGSVPPAQHDSIRERSVFITPTILPPSGRMLLQAYGMQPPLSPASSQPVFPFSKCSSYKCGDSPYNMAVVSSQPGQVSGTPVSAPHSAVAVEPPSPTPLPHYTLYPNLCPTSMYPPPRHRSASRCGTTAARRRTVPAAEPCARRPTKYHARPVSAAVCDRAYLLSGHAGLNSAR